MYTKYEFLVFHCFLIALTVKTSLQGNISSRSSKGKNKEVEVLRSDPQLEEPEQLTPAQIAEFKEAFDIIDESGDRTIGFQEMKKLMKVLGEKVNEDELIEILNNADINGDGKVDFNDFLSQITKRPAGHYEGLRDGFRTFDRSGDGYISFGEFTNAMSKLNLGLSGEDLYNMFHEADVDGESGINFKEFAAVMNKYIPNHRPEEDD